MKQIAIDQVSQFGRDLIEMFHAMQPSFSYSHQVRNFFVVSKHGLQGASLQCARGPNPDWKEVFPYLTLKIRHIQNAVSPQAFRQRDFYSKSTRSLNVCVFYKTSSLISSNVKEINHQCASIQGIS